MFTDRFIEVPIQIYNTNHKEITGKEILRDSYEKINPMDISSYRPTSYDDDDDGELLCTSVEFKNSRTTVVLLPIGEFESLLNTFF